MALASKLLSSSLRDYNQSPIHSSGKFKILDLAQFKAGTNHGFIILYLYKLFIFISTHIISVLIAHSSRSGRNSPSHFENYPLSPELCLNAKKASDRTNMLSPQWEPWNVCSFIVCDPLGPLALSTAAMVVGHRNPLLSGCHPVAQGSTELFTVSEGWQSCHLPLYHLGSRTLSTYSSAHQQISPIPLPSPPFHPWAKAILP